MFKEILDYKSPQGYGNNNKGQNGKPLKRSYIHLLIKEEEAKPGCTGLNVIKIDGHYYVSGTIKIRRLIKKKTTKP